MAYRNTMASAILCQETGYGKLHSVMERLSVDRAKLVAFRTAKGWSIRKLVQKAGVDYSSYWRLEKGQAHNPRIETIQKVARALEVTVEELTVIEGEGSITQGPAGLAGAGTVDPPAVSDEIHDIIRLAAYEGGRQGAMEFYEQMSRRPSPAGPNPNDDPILARIKAEVSADIADMTLAEIEEARRCVLDVARRHRRSEGERLQAGQ